MTQGDSYAEFERFSLPENGMSAAGRAAAVLATPGGRIEVLTTSENETLSVNENLAAVAIDQYVFSAAEGTVQARTRSGIELWSTTIGSVNDLAPVGSGGVLACVTADGRLVGLDAETGAELFAVDRPHADVGEPVAVAGGGGSVAVATWSFLTVLDETGSVVCDRNLDGAISQVAIVADAVLAKLKDGQLVRLRLPEGEQAWIQSTAASDITAFEAGVLAVTAETVLFVDEHGTVNPLSIEGGKQILATSEGSIVLTGTEGTWKVHRRDTGEPTLEATPLTETVRTERSMDFRLQNTGAGSFDGSVTVAADGVELADTTVQVSIVPGETKPVRFPVETVTSETASVTLQANGRTIENETFETEHGATDIPVEATVNGVTRTPAGLKLDLQLKNDGDQAVEVAVGDKSEHLPPGEYATLSPTVDGSGEKKELLIQSPHGTGDLSVTVPQVGLPSIALEASGTRSEPFLDVQVVGPESAGLVGTLVLEYRVGPRIERELDLPTDRQLLLTVPLTEGAIESGIGEVTASLEGHGVSETVAFGATEWKATGSHLGDEEDVSGALDVHRDVPESVAWGRRFSESVIVTNRGSSVVEGATVGREDGPQLPALEPGESATLTRHHAAFETGSLVLDQEPVTAGNLKDEIPAREISVQQNQVGATGQITCDSEMKVALTCHNGSDHPVQVRKIGLGLADGGQELWSLSNPRTIDPGESAAINVRATDTEIGTPPIPAGLRYRTPDEEEHTALTLLAVDTDDQGPISLSVESRQQPTVDRNTPIECVFTAGTALSAVTVEAVGSPVTALASGERKVGQLGPGEADRQIVDIAPSSAGPSSFTLSISGQTETGAFEKIYEISGPVRTDSGAGESGTWNSRPADAEGSAGHPNHLITPYRRTARNHQ